MNWETVIGIEVHVQLATKSKIFSGASTTYGAPPNTQACAIDLGMPGVLPVLNKTAVEYALRFGLSVNAHINQRSVFARKNYFYPDLPKGYQISQYEIPIVGAGFLDVSLEGGKQKRIGITRAHLEEDAGKSLHGEMGNASGIDLNRAGVPLLEIVSEPDMRSASEAVAYLKTLHTLVCYLGICDGNMQEGSFRCDVNVSVRPVGQKEFGTRTETKNVNSFRFVEAAIEYEVARQIDVLSKGGKIHQETRTYDADKNITRSLRSKENANDYRYFPDPDLLPVVVENEWLEAIRKNMPELPKQKQQRLQETLGLNEYDASLLTNNHDMANYFEAVLNAGCSLPAKLVANWMMGDVSAYLNKNHLEFSQAPITPTQLAQLLLRIHDQTISNSIAKTVFEAICNGEGNADNIIEKRGLKQMNDTGALQKIVDDIIAKNPAQVAEFKSGKEKLFGFFVGQAMKATQGKANPEQLNALIREKLKP